LLLNFGLMLVEGHGQLAGFFKQDLPAGHSGTGRLNFKMVRERNPLLLLAGFCTDISKMPVD